VAAIKEGQVAMLKKQPCYGNAGQNFEESAVDEMIEKLVTTVVTGKVDLTQQAAAGVLQMVPRAACNRFAARLVEMVKSRKKPVRQRAADCLVAMGAVAVHPLFEALRDSRAPTFRIRVAGILAQALRTQQLADFSQIAVGLFAIVLRTGNIAVAQAVWDVHGVFRQSWAGTVNQGGPPPAATNCPADVTDLENVVHCKTSIATRPGL
jgi:hypothetical protein